MSTTRKKRPVIYVKSIYIYCKDPTIEQKIKATMAAHCITSVSKAIRYLLEHRRVDTHYIKYSLDDTMWLFVAIRKELQLLEISITQIKNKLAQISIMHVNGNSGGNQLAFDPEELMHDKIKQIFNIIAKLSYQWLPK